MFRGHAAGSSSTRLLLLARSPHIMTLPEPCAEANSLSLFVQHSHLTRYMSIVLVCPDPASLHCCRQSRGGRQAGHGQESERSCTANFPAGQAVDLHMPRVKVHGQRIQNREGPTQFLACCTSSCVQPDAICPACAVCCKSACTVKLVGSLPPMCCLPMSTSALGSRHAGCSIILI